MTPDQHEKPDALTEKVAREICQAQGVDPDALSGQGNGDGITWEPCAEWERRIPQARVAIVAVLGHTLQTINWSCDDDSNQFEELLTRYGSQK